MLSGSFNLYFYQVIGGVDSCPLVKDGLTQFSSLVDLSLSILRELRILKNDRILLRCLESLAIASSLTLGTRQKEVQSNSVLADSRS